MLFFKVYVYFILIATGAIMQNLEGLHIFSIWQGLFINYQTSYVVLSVLLTLFMIFLALLNIHSAFFLSNAAGLWSVGLWLTPGILSLIIGEPLIALSGPSTYYIGSGEVGTGLGNLFDAIIVAIFAWSLLTIITVLIRTTQRYKNIYDVIWYTLALGAIFFFANEIYLRELKSSLDNDYSKLKSGYTTLAQQLSNTQDLCKTINNKDFDSFCKWVGSAKNYIDFKLEHISDVSLYHDNMITIDDLMGHQQFLPDQKEEIKYIKNFDQAVCSNEDYSDLCSKIDFQLVINSEDLYTNHLLSPDVIITKMNQEYISFKKRYEENSQWADYNNYRWIYFLTFAFVIGGKIAISTKDLFYVEDKRDALYIKLFYKKIIKIIKIIFNLIIEIVKIIAFIMQFIRFMIMQKLQY